MLNNEALLAKIKNLYQDPHAKKIETVQALWSGYGEIARYYLPSINSYCIAKHVNLTANTLAKAAHPRDWGGDLSHQRKVSSYINEQQFYTHLAKLCNNTCTVPQLKASYVTDRSICLIMQDLNAAGYKLRHDSGTSQNCRQAVYWLANFHATFLHANINCVWPIGSYWHLQTRPDEWASMAESKLKHAASRIDQILNAAPYQTLIHGDAKLANFCFAEHSTNIAGVDFQYTGKGCGVKDIVYLLGSCFDDTQLAQQAPIMINEYFKHLTNALSKKLSNTQLQALESTWRTLIPFAWADFERFLMGWAPDHYKRSEYSHSQTNIALKSL